VTAHGQNFLTSTSEKLQESQQNFFDAADGFISFDELADTSVLNADAFGQITNGISALGTPPPELAETVRLSIRASERFEEALELAARGARTVSVPMIEEATAAIAEGAAFLVAANANLLFLKVIADNDVVVRNHRATQMLATG